MLDSLVERIDDNTVIITANQRLADNLLDLAVGLSYTKSADDPAFLSQLLINVPKIYSLHTWLYLAWQEFAVVDNVPILLSKNQELLILEDLIIDTKVGSLLFKVNVTAKLALSALDLMCKWQLPIGSSPFLDDDILAFNEWAIAYYHLMAANNWLSNAMLLDLVNDKIKSRVFNVAKLKFIFVGFDDIYPQLLKLITTLNSYAYSMEIFKCSEKKAIVATLKFNTVQDELYAAAKYALEFARENSGKPHQIAIVVPDLAVKRELVEQIFLAVFHGDLLASPQSCTKPLFNISVGCPLIEYPVVRAAFEILDLSFKDVKLDLFSLFLHNIFIAGSNAEFIERAKIDVLLRKFFADQSLSLTLREIIIWLKKQELGLNISLSLEKFIFVVDQMPLKASFFTWRGYIIKLLQTMGWPGERGLNSLEYQTVNKFLAMLDDFVTLDVVKKPITWFEVRKILWQLALDTVFQAQGDKVSVQILGVLEAASSPFNCVWVTSLTTEVWPSTPSPNPFISYQLQKELKMPHASAEREIAFAREVMYSFYALSDEVILSYHTNFEQRILQPSALLAEINATRFFEVIDKKLVHIPFVLEQYIDNFGPKLEQDLIISGGVSVINYQSMCPFKAFAKFRLNAQGISKAEPLISLAKRGSLVHLCLELIWKKIKTAEYLQSITIDALFALVLECASLAMNKIFPLEWTSVIILQLEHQRLINLLVSWLELEKQRGKFIAEAFEVAHQVDVYGLKLNLRIDRVDRLSDNSLVLIDYKTNQANLNAWFTDRPDDLQLPLYCITSKAMVGTLLLAKVRPNSCEFLGISESIEYFSGLSGVVSVDELLKKSMSLKDTSISSFSDLNQYWRNILRQLASEFISGNAVVAPKELGITCRTCDLQTLCRVRFMVNIDAK